MSTLEICAALETPELQLSCFNDIIADSKTADMGQEGVVAEPVAESPAIEVEAVPEAQPPIEVTSREVPTVEAVADTTPVVAATTTATVVETTTPLAPAPAVAPEPSPAAAGAAPVSVASGKLGEEHLERPVTEKKTDDDKVFWATVIEVSEGRNGLLYFHFDNGQVWRQMEARHLEYPRSGEFDIKITQGMMGDYRMRIGEKGRMVRIRRVR